MFKRLKQIFQKILLISTAIDKYKKETVIQSLPAISYVNRAKKYIDNNDFTMAEKILTEALSLPQKDALVHKYLGLVYEKTGRFDLSVENYQISAELNPNDKNIWQRLGFALLSSDKYERAIKSFENANRVQAGNTDTYTGLGMSYMKLENYKDAYENFLKAVSLNKYNFSALFLAAVMEIKMEMYDRADSKLAFLSNVAPNEGNTFEYARLKALRDDVDNAIFYANKSLKINPLMLPSYVLLGQIYTKKLDKASALKNFETAAQKGMKSAEFYYEWGKSMLHFEMYNDAKEKFEKALEISPENAEFAVYLALSCILNDEFDTVENLVAEIKNKQPDNPVLQLVLGIIDFKNGNYADAIQKLKQNGENPINCLYTAMAYEKNGNDGKAREYYELALRYNEKYENAYKKYIDFLISKNDYVEANRKLRKALKHFENNTDLLNLMFFVSYILVKDNFSDYNVKEALSIADKIEKSGAEFKYDEQRQEIKRLLGEREKNCENS